VSAKALVAEPRSAREDAAEQEGSKKGMTLADLFGKPKVYHLNLILRADTQGSLEAIKGVIARGPIRSTRSMSRSCWTPSAPPPSPTCCWLDRGATVMSFGVTAPGAVKKAAERQGIPLKNYRIIYDLIEDVQRIIQRSDRTRVRRAGARHAEVRQVIRVPP
jgi:translation initiation factor IF-2